MRLSWAVHPAKERKLAAVAVTLFLLLVYYTVYDLLGQMYVWIAVLFTIAPLSSFFFPTQYCIDNNGIRIKHIIFDRYRKWDEFCGCDVQHNGVFLKTLSKESFVDHYRGVLIYCNTKNETKITDLIKERLHEQRENTKNR